MFDPSRRRGFSSPLLDQARRNVAAQVDATLALREKKAAEPPKKLR